MFTVNKAKGLTSLGQRCYKQNGKLTQCFQCIEKPSVSTKYVELTRDFFFKIKFYNGNKKLRSGLQNVRAKILLSNFGPNLGRAVWQLPGVLCAAGILPF